MRIAVNETSRDVGIGATRDAREAAGGCFKRPGGSTPGCVKALCEWTEHRGRLSERPRFNSPLRNRRGTASHQLRTVRLPGKHQSLRLARDIARRQAGRMRSASRKRLGPRWSRSASGTRRPRPTWHRRRCQREASSACIAGPADRK